MPEMTRVTPPAGSPLGKQPEMVIV
jgi:hypothetical protein